MDVRRVAIKKRGRRIVEANDICCRTVFDLNAKQSFGNRGQIFYRVKPPADDADRSVRGESRNRGAESDKRVGVPRSAHKLAERGDRYSRLWVRAGNPGVYFW